MLTDGGVDKMKLVLPISMMKTTLILHHVNQTMKAHLIFKRDKYVIRDGEVQIVDENTGRLMPGRRWSDGLHQQSKREGRGSTKSQTYLDHLSNYFRMYNKLSGMTGTAETEEEEFRKIYNLEVVVYGKMIRLTTTISFTKPLVKSLRRS